MTGVQAFLRDDLTVFCREAPSEFNDHQREVFCVFSGSGVARLREYLNGGGTNTPLETGVIESDDEEGEAPAPPTHRHMPNGMPWPHGDQDGMEDEDMDDDETPVEGQGPMPHGLPGLGATGHLVDMHMNSSPGTDNVQIMATPQGLGLSQRELIYDRFHERIQSWDGVGGAMWAHGPSYGGAGPSGTMQTLPSQAMSQSGPSTGIQTTMGNDTAASPPSMREAQHMMGAVNMVDSEEGA